jgi:protein-disulfide isomerase
MSVQNRSELAVPVDDIDHIKGPATARVTVVEYGDFECPMCKQAAPAVKLMLNRFAAEVRFVYRHFPLEEVHPHALLAAEVAEIASGQGKFWLMHDLLFDNQSHLKAKQLRSYADKLELDLVRYDQEIEGEVYRQRIREHLDGGRRSGVRATPTFFMNGKIHDVSYGIQHLLEGVEVELQKSVVTEILQDGHNNAIGAIETKPDGSQILRDENGKIRGYYDSSTDHTRGSDQRILAKGNLLRTLIC